MAGGGAQHGGEDERVHAYLAIVMVSPLRVKRLIAAPEGAALSKP
jgi:hypothetical protein